jgi:hypothetical protein
VGAAATSQVGPVLPDGPGLVSETRRYTRETGVVTPLDRSTSSNPVDVGWGAARTRLSVGMPAAGELPAGYEWLGSGGHGEGLRRSHGDAAGVEPGASLVDRTAVNVGTARIAFHHGAPARREGVDRSDADRRVRVGRSRRSTPRSDQSRLHGEGRQRVSQSEGL